jgi:hypothetical protein
MKVKMQALKAGWCAEAEVNGETYRWECWGYSRAEARKEAVKEFTKAARRDAATERARRKIIRGFINTTPSRHTKPQEARLCLPHHRTLEIRRRHPALDARV